MNKSNHGVWSSADEMMEGSWNEDCIRHSVVMAAPTSGLGTATTKPCEALFRSNAKGRFISFMIGIAEAQLSFRPTPMFARGCFISVLATGYAQ